MAKIKIAPRARLKRSASIQSDYDKKRSPSDAVDDFGFWRNSRPCGRRRWLDCEEPVWRCSVVGPRPHLRRSGHIDTSNTNPPHLVASGNFALCAFSIISLSHDFTLELLTNSAFKTLPSASTVSLI